MPKIYSVTCTDTEAGQLIFYRGGDGLPHVTKDFVTDGPRSENVDLTFGQLVAGGVITSGERTALIATLQKINTGLRTVAGLNP